MGMARSLMIKSKVYHQTLTSILENDPSITTAAFDEQFRRLILEPLHHKPPPANHPLIILIDALDECDEDASRTLTKLFKDSVPELPHYCVRVVDNHLLGHSSIHHMTIKLSDDKNLQDCKAYIHAQVLDLNELCQVTSGDWPPDFEQKLVRHAHGLFVWVSTVMEYLKYKSINPIVVLEDLLDQDTS